MKVATFTIRADVRQSARWKMAAEAEGFASVGSWAASALDAYLENRARAGRPLPLAWRKGRFLVALESGAELQVSGWIGRPFGHFRGDEIGVKKHGTHVHSLVYLPSRAIVATMRNARNCRALAAELAARWPRLGGRQPSEDPAPLLQRFQREDV